MPDDLAEHDWEKVRNALYHLLAHTEPSEPKAVELVPAIIAVLESLPE